LSANSVMRGRLDARRTLKSLVADLRLKKETTIRNEEKSYKEGTAPTHTHPPCPPYFYNPDV
ncbi:hypothetical protein GAB07_18425, partial [Bacteroides thetaiotaomicron]